MNSTLVLNTKALMNAIRLLVLLITSFVTLHFIFMPREKSGRQVCQQLNFKESKELKSYGSCKSFIYIYI